MTKSGDCGVGRLEPPLRQCAVRGCRAKEQEIRVIVRKGPTDRLRVPLRSTWVEAKVASMSDESKQPEAEITDRGEIRKSLSHLDRSISWFWWNTIVVIGLLVAALAAVTPIPPMERFVQANDLDMTAIVRGFLALMVVVNAYTLYHQRHLKQFRHRLAEQLVVATEHRTRADKFYGLAILDPLTGLYNRRFGEESLAKEITRTERAGEELAVILVDLDHFKEINDQYGHAAGDTVLKEFSRRLRRGIRACDVPVRIGGDEFLVVLPECPKENVHIMLSRLGPFEVMLDRQKVPVSFSIGSAQYQVCDTVQTLVKRADEVLYAAKAARPNRGGTSARVASPTMPKRSEGMLPRTLPTALLTEEPSWESRSEKALRIRLEDSKASKDSATRARYAR
jgi:diguanylate cyclase (GGDEF)-like protein